MNYELEPSDGPFDWEEAFRQAKRRGEDPYDSFCLEPECDDPDHGHGGPVSEESQQMMAALITVEAEEVLSLESRL